MYCLDANVWVYFLDADLPEHNDVHDAVAAVLRDRPLFTTTVLQMEVVHYLTNQLANSTEAVQRVLSIEDATVASLTPPDVQRAAEILAKHDDAGIGGRDATVIAAMERHGVSTLWTHDHALLRMDDELDWLAVTDPVVGD